MQFPSQSSMFNEHLLITLQVINSHAFQSAGCERCMHVVSIGVYPISQRDPLTTSKTDQLITPYSCSRPWFFRIRLALNHSWEIIFWLVKYTFTFLMKNGFRCRIYISKSYAGGLLDMLICLFFFFITQSELMDAKVWFARLKFMRSLSLMIQF